MFSLEKFILYLMWWNLMPGQILLFVSSRSVLNKEHMSSLNHWRSGGGGEGGIYLATILPSFVAGNLSSLLHISVQPSIKDFQKLFGGGGASRPLRPLSPSERSPLASIFCTFCIICYMTWYNTIRELEYVPIILILEP